MAHSIYYPGIQSSYTISREEISKGVTVAFLVCGVALMILGGLIVGSHSGVVILASLKGVHALTAIGLTSGGIFITGICISRLIKKVKNYYNEPKKFKVDQLIDNGGKSDNPVQPRIINLWDFLDVEQNVFQTLITKGSKLKEGEKIYFDADGSKKSKVESKISIKRANGQIFLKNRQFFEKGVSKKVFFQIEPTQAKVMVIATEEPSDTKQSNYEKRIQTRLKHSTYVVRMVDAHEKLDQTSNKTKRRYLSEYCTEGTVKRPRTALSFHQSLQIFSDCLRGLTDLHNKGYLHFDLHEGNLFIDNGRGKLGDFGNARKATRVSNPTYFKKAIIDNSAWTGCRALLAPEMLANIYYIGKNQQDKAVAITDKADVWSMGITMALYLYNVDKKKLKYSVYTQELPAYLRFLQQQKPTHTNGGYYPEGIPPDRLLPIIREQLKATAPPSDQSSIDYLLWQMTHPDPAMRPNATEAADFIDNYLNKQHHDDSSTI